MLSKTLAAGLESYEIGPKIWALRLKKNIGLVQLGEHTGLSPGMLSKIERGQLFPTLPTLLKIAMVFGLGLEHFFVDRRTGRPSLGTLLAAVGLAFLTGRIAPYAAILVVLGGIALLFGYVLDRFLLRWPAAGAADLVFLTLGLRSVTEGVSNTPAAALFVQILFLANYLGSVAARTLFLNRDVVSFEVIQSVATIAIGLGGAAHVTRARVREARRSLSHRWCSEWAATRSRWRCCSRPEMWRCRGSIPC